jgi:hypothetical protein
MDTQNVSAQLYEKQLPDVPLDYNCITDPTVPFLQTCVSDTQTDVNIENAFQKQLDLSEYYKSPLVFNQMKEEFMDKTMDHENTPVVDVPVTKETASNEPELIPVGPRDFLEKLITKESFGVPGTKWTIIFLLIALIVGLIIYKMNSA